MVAGDDKNPLEVLRKESGFARKKYLGFAPFQNPPLFLVAGGKNSGGS